MKQRDLLPSMSFPDEGSTYAILRRSIRLTVTPAQVSLPAAFRTGTVAVFYPLHGTISITSLSFRLFFFQYHFFHAATSPPRITSIGGYDRSCARNQRSLLPANDALSVYAATAEKRSREKCCCFFVVVFLDWCRSDQMRIIQI